MYRKPELLAPAGDFEKLKFALSYGADAVYAGGRDFSLRQFSKNFTDDELLRAIEYTHNMGKKLYVTVNIYARNYDFDRLEKFLRKLDGHADAFIISDPGIVLLAKEIAPNTPIHISTQANTTNFMAVRFWERQGIKRINLARELSKEEIEEIRKSTSMELEIFLHGAVCMSYSGRCFLSLYLTGRDGNRGQCTQPCRWEYVMWEKKREEEVFSIMQDQRGTYFFNAKDIALIEFLPEVLKIGVDSLKIEGRTKNINYVATVTRVYREAIDSFFENPHRWEPKREWLEEINQVSNRQFTSGFFPGDLRDTLVDLDKSYRFRYRFAGIVMESTEELPQKNLHLINPRFVVYRGETVYFLTPSGKRGQIVVTRIYDPEKGEEVDKSYPGKNFYWEISETLPPGTILRIKNRTGNGNLKEKVLY